MESDEDLFQESGSESDMDDELTMEMEPVESSSAQDRHDEEDFQYEVLTADQIVQYMVQCIKEVNSVVQVSDLD